MTNEEYKEYKEEYEREKTEQEELDTELKNLLSDEEYMSMKELTNKYSFEETDDEEYLRMMALTYKEEKTRAELDILFPDGMYREIEEKKEKKEKKKKEKKKAKKVQKARRKEEEKEREEGKNLSIFQKMSFTRGPFNRRKMFFYGLLVPFFIFLLGSYIGGYLPFKYLATLGVVAVISILLFLVSVFKRAKDLDENPYGTMFLLLIPILNLFTLFDLFLDKGYGDYSDYDD